ncbi:hypothetical protein IWX49DRAFT_555212 [Phyllosticta citricarpa]|uniref:DUF221-domain-containing protein n=2 Tax=Phyllosticta TaxID=121621 RepID=A0ABR1M0V5_9PEZI
MSPRQVVASLRTRADEESSADKFLDLIQSPFNTELDEKAFWSSLGYSLGAAAIFAFLFCLLRPYNNTVYAPRLKHADEKHAPPPVKKGVFDWVQPVLKTKEQLLVEKVGLDAAVFLRFTKMCRNIFIILSLLGCGVYIPINLVQNAQNHATSDNSLFMKLTPLGVWGASCWAHVLLSYIFNGIIFFFLWRNYRAVAKLRREYFESNDYQKSLHSRTLMVTDIPRGYRTDDGIVKITEEIKVATDAPSGVIARNVKDLPRLIEDHEAAVRHLEEVLAKYLKNPNKLPMNRPVCKTHKNDRSYTKPQKVDAIDYLTSRIKSLELEITEVRLSVDNRNALPYGFASYDSIEEAHGVAYAAKRKHPHGSSVRLAPKPSDLIWKNLPLDKKTRVWRTIFNNIWVTLLTLVWIVPNAMIAVFLANLTNLGAVWHDFQVTLSANPKFWGAVQGIAAPLVTTLFYFFLPIIFRRISINAGDYSKTSRERHVMHKLYSFFVFNNLIVFSLFSTAWRYAVAIIDTEQTDNIDAWTAIQSTDLYGRLMTAFCQVSPFWLNYLLQRNFGAAWDLSQLGNMFINYAIRTFSSPTPRRLIELSAPPAFDYACYYNFFLFYSTIALVFAPFQPLVLPVACLYFTLDSYLKKYLLLYVFITKHESGGAFWRVLFNRFMFAAGFANLVAFLFVMARKENMNQAACMFPLPLVLIGFKWWCKRKYDNQMHFYSKGSQKGREEGLPERPKQRSDRVGVRFGHPALYKPLMTPMVHAKSQHLLREIYRGRLDQDTDGAPVTAYSDTYDMTKMSKARVGKAAANASPFEIVTEAQMDFENYKNRPEFREEFGGDGELYSRPSTPTTFRTGFDSRPGSPALGGYASNSRPSSPAYGSRPGSPSVLHNPYDPLRPSHDSQRTFTDLEHPMPVAGGASRAYSPLSNTVSNDVSLSDVSLVAGAAPMGGSSLRDPSPAGRGGRSVSPRPGLAASAGYRQVPLDETPGGELAGEETSYDFFRGRRAR